MPWYVYVAYFFGGASVSNAVLHLVMGATGRRFPTPFASPPFRGLSSPAVNLCYAAINLAVAYTLLALVRAIDLTQWTHVAAALAGFTLMTLQIARSLRHMREARR